MIVNIGNLTYDQRCTIGICICVLGILVIAFGCWFGSRLPSLPKTGTRSYYAKNRELLAYVHGEYLGECFVPSMNIEERLRDNLERVVLVETIPDS